MPEKMIFQQKFDRGGLRFENQDYDSCIFSNCTKPEAMSWAKNIELLDCFILNCAIGPAILEDVRIHNPKTDDLQIIWSYGSRFH